MDSFGFLKVAAAVPARTGRRLRFQRGAHGRYGRRGGTAGRGDRRVPRVGPDGLHLRRLLLQPALLDAADEALARLVRDTRKLPLTLIAGAPLRHGQTLYNCAVVFTQGRILGVVPKTYIPDYTEFYENRWFASGAGISEETIPVAGRLRISARASRSRSTARSSAWKSAKTSGRQCRPRRTWHSAARR